MPPTSGKTRITIGLDNDVIGHCQAMVKFVGSRTTRPCSTTRYANTSEAHTSKRLCARRFGKQSRR